MDHLTYNLCLYTSILTDRQTFQVLGATGYASTYKFMCATLIYCQNYKASVSVDLKIALSSFSSSQL